MVELTSKDTNPKDAVGTKKWRVYSTVPMTVIWELGVAMLEGARKYGRHNYRVAGVRASVYIDAAKGHIDTWWEGEDIDAESRLSHITKAIASLTVLRDAMIQNKFVDDRPPRTDMDAFRTNLQAVVNDLFERIPDAKPAYTELGQREAFKQHLSDVANGRTARAGNALAIVGATGSRIGKDIEKAVAQQIKADNEAIRAVSRKPKKGRRK